MDLATRSTKKTSHLSQDSRIITPKIVHNPFNKTENNFNQLSKDSSSLNRRNHEFKQTSLPFHQAHKQSYDAFIPSPNQKRISQNYWRDMDSSASGHDQSSQMIKSSKQEKEKLEQLYDELTQFYQKEKSLQDVKEQYSKQQNKIKEEIVSIKRSMQADELKTFLFHQMQEKQIQKYRQNLQDIQDSKHKFSTLDPNLVSAFPKISETPKHLQNLQLKTKQTVYQQELNDQVKTNQDLRNQEHQRDMEDYTNQLEYTYNKHDKQQNQQREYRRKGQDQAKKEWETNLIAKEVMDKVQKGADRLQYEIIHGKYGNPLNQTQQYGSIVKIDSQADEQRSENGSETSMMSNSRFSYRKNQNSCNFFLGTQSYNKTPSTAYQEAFRSPNVNRSKNHIRRTQGNSLEKLDQVTSDKSPDVEQNRTFNREDVIEEEDDENLDKGEQNLQESAAINEGRQSIIKEVGADDEQSQVTDFKDDITEDKQQANGDNRSRIKDDIKSIYSIALNQARSRVKREDIQKLKSEFKLSQQNLDQFTSTQYSSQTMNHNKSHYRVLSETASTISSKIVQEKIRKYTDQVIPPSLAQQELNLNPLQYDHLKRFIKQLEEDAIQAKRIAKDARQHNKQYDQRVIDEEKHNQTMKSKFRKSILAQIKSNSEHRQEFRDIDLSKPHIEGVQGYPPMAEPSKVEAQLFKRKIQRINKANLEDQMKQNDVMNKTQIHMAKDEFNMLTYEKLKDGAEKDAEHRSRSLQQQNEMNEAWVMTQKIKDLKLKIQKELGLAVNDDKLIQMMNFNLSNPETTPKNHDFLASFTGLNNSLFQRKRLQTTTGSLINQINSPSSSAMLGLVNEDDNKVIRNHFKHRDPSKDEKLRHYQERLQDKISETLSHFERKKQSQQSIRSSSNNNGSIKLQAMQQAGSAQVIQKQGQHVQSMSLSNDRKYPWEDRNISKEQIGIIKNNLQ